MKKISDIWQTIMEPKGNEDIAFIVKDMCQEKTMDDDSKNKLPFLQERRDYAPEGHDILEQQAMQLLQEGKLPKELKEQLKERMKPFPDKGSSIIKLKLAQGKSPRRILIDYYNSLHFSSLEEKLDNKKVIKILASSPITFFKELAEQLQVKLSDVINLFRESSVVKFFGKIGWNFQKLYDMLKTGYQKSKELTQIIKQFIEENKIIKMSTDVLKKWDEWLSKHPELKRWGGPVLGCILVFIYYNTAFIGDPTYDFDLSDVLDAFAGKITLADIFGGANGVKLMAAVGAGMLLNVSFPWPMISKAPNLIQFISMIIGTLVKKLRKTLRKESFIINRSETMKQKVIDSVIREAKLYKSALNKKKIENSYGLIKKKLQKIKLENLSKEEIRSLLAYEEWADGAPDSYLNEIIKGKFDKENIESLKNKYNY